MVNRTIYFKVKEKYYSFTLLDIIESIAYKSIIVQTSKPTKRRERSRMYKKWCEKIYNSPTAYKINISNNRENMIAAALFVYHFCDVNDKDVKIIRDVIW